MRECAHNVNLSPEMDKDLLGIDETVRPLLQAMVCIDREEFPVWNGCGNPQKPAYQRIRVCQEHLAPHEKSKAGKKKSRNTLGKLKSRSWKKVKKVEVSKG